MSRLGDCLPKSKMQHPLSPRDHDISADLQHLSGVMLFHEVDP